jgi:hypothetical protein
MVVLLGCAGYVGCGTCPELRWSVHLQGGDAEADKAVRRVPAELVMGRGSTWLAVLIRRLSAMIDRRVAPAAADPGAGTADEAATDRVIVSHR